MKGSIRRRSKDSWELTIDLGRGADGKRLRKFVNVKGKKSEADAKLRELLSSLDQGLPLGTGKTILSDFLEKWMEVHSSRVRERTIYGYRNVLRRYVVPCLGSKQLTLLRPSDLDGLYTQMLQRGLSPRTVLQTHRIVKKALKQAVRWNLIARNPVDLVDPPKYKRKEMPVLDVAQLSKLLNRASASQFGPPLYLASVTGMRRGEIVGLQWQDIDFQHMLISVNREIVFVPKQGHLVTPPKSAESRRTIDITHADVTKLIRHRAHQSELKLKAGTAWQDANWVFTNEFGSHIKPNALSRAVQKFRTELGLPAVRLHDLRHTHSTLLLEAGVPLKVVQERLGHSSIAITADIYAHVTPGMQKAAAEAFQAILSPELKELIG
jgi:integrase